MIQVDTNPIPRQETRDGLIPIVIGVTGHRDIPVPDSRLLYAAIRDYLKIHFIEKFQHSPVIFLSALAEGGDRIAAQAALAAGCRLGVYLPFPETEYELDFESTESKEEFHSLLAQAEFVEIAERPIDALPDDRVQGYISVGIVIARHSQCLFALWDGLEIHKPGGTSDVVRMYREGIPSLRAKPEDLISNPETGPVIHFLTRRASSPDAIPDGDVGNGYFLPPKPTGQSAATQYEQDRWDKVFHCIERFNQDTASYSTPSETHPYSQQWLVSDANLANQWPTDDGKARRIAQVYAAANFTSIQSQQTRLLAFKQIIGLALLAVFFEQLYSGPFAFPILLAASIGLALTATWRYFQLTKLRLEERYLDYRALAEAARVNFFWHVSGLPDSPAEHYLRDQRDELEWLRQAIRTLGLPAGKPTMQPSCEAGIQLVRQAWILDQLDYFTKNAPNNDKDAELLATRAKRWFMSGIVTVILTLVFHSSVNMFDIAVNELLIPSLTVVYAFALTVSGLIKIYSGIMAHQEQANRYRKMIIYYSLCDQQLRQVLAQGQLALACPLLLAMGCQALTENAEWLLLHRERPVEVPL